jgi:hypothetical protein
MEFEIPGYELGAAIGQDDAAETCRGRRLSDGLEVSAVVLPERDPAGRAWELVDMEALNDVVGVVAVIESGVTPSGRPYVVSERARHGALADRLSRGRLRPVEAVAVGLSVGRVLADARAAGFGHGRLSPANVITGPHGRTSVTGFLPVRRDIPETEDVAALGRLVRRTMAPPTTDATGTAGDHASGGAVDRGAASSGPVVPVDLAAAIEAAVEAGGPDGYDTMPDFVEGLRAVARAHGWPSDRPVVLHAAGARPRAGRRSHLGRTRPARRRRWRSWYWVPTVAAIGVAAAALTFATNPDDPDGETVAVPAARAAIQPSATALPTGSSSSSPTSGAPATTAAPTTAPATTALATTAPPSTAAPATTAVPATAPVARPGTPDPDSDLDRSGPPPMWVVEPDGSVTDSINRMTWLGPVTATTIDVAVRSDGFGGWQLLADGRIRPFGDVPTIGSGRLLVPLGEQPVELVADATETGLWVVFADGGVVAVDADLPARTGPALTAGPPIVAADRSVGGAGYLTLDSSGRIAGAGDAVVRGSATGYLAGPLVGLLVFNEAHVVVAADGSFLVISGSGDQVTHELGQLEVTAPVQKVRRSADRVVVVDADGALAVFDTDAVVGAV